MKNHHYIKEGMMLAKSAEWETSEIGFSSDGIGDCIGRSSTAALIYNKPEMLQQCVDLLKVGKRWPDELQDLPDREGKIACNRVDYILSWMLWKLNIRTHRKFRSQKRLTRDPFIGTIVALWLMPYKHINVYGEAPFYHSDTNWYWKQKIKELKIPFWLNCPDLYHWKKYLETGKPRHKRKYEWWVRFSLNKKTPGYVLYHMAWMAHCADSDTVEVWLGRYISEWNLLLKHLYKLLDVVDRWKAKAYQAKNGDQWAEDSWHVIPGPGDNNHYYLDEADEYKMDKDLLNWAIKNV